MNAFARHVEKRSNITQLLFTSKIWLMVIGACLGWSFVIPPEPTWSITNKVKYNDWHSSFVGAGSWFCLTDKIVLMAAFKYCNHRKPLWSFQIGLYISWPKLKLSREKTYQILRTAQLARALWNWLLTPGKFLLYSLRLGETKGPSSDFSTWQQGHIFVFWSL